MSEIKKEVKTFKVVMQCDFCNEGVMIPTGQVLTSYPAQYHHQCVICGEVAIYFKSYPYLSTEEL